MSGNKQDMFRFVDNLRDSVRSLKNILKKQSLKVSINNKKYNVIGKTGMYHIVIDITDGEEIKINDEVIIPVNPLDVDRNIERKYV